MAQHLYLEGIALLARLLICGPFNPDESAKELTRRDGRTSPAFSNVDYVDHSAELYELPAKVSIIHE